MSTEQTIIVIVLSMILGGGLAVGAFTYGFTKKMKELQEKNKED